MRLGGMLFLLCGMLTVGALAANPGPGELKVELSYANVGAGATNVANGDPVNGGYAALLEDGMQVNVSGAALTPIQSGEVLFSYAFDPNKTYEVMVQEGMTAPYYEAKTISVPAATVTGAISTGATITETVNWVEWSKPIKVTVEDTQGNPAPVGTLVTVTATMAEPDNPTYQTVEITKATDMDGIATFYDLSYDPNDADMRNIYSNRFFVTVQCGDTTIAQFYDLEQVMSNVVTLTWPTATVSGKVYQVNGQPAANQRVASYSQLMTPCTTDVKGNWDWGTGESMAEFDQFIPTGGKEEQRLMRFPLRGQVYYTTTAADGSYTLALPEGVFAELCVDDADYAPDPQSPVGTIFWYSNVINYDYAAKAFPHFPWMRTMRTQGDDAPYDRFLGLRCLESTTMSCVPYGAMAGMDLSMGRTEYTLKGRLLDGNTPFEGEVRLERIGGSAGNTSVHAGGGISETVLTGSVSGGTINERNAKLVPGSYTLYATPVSGFQDPDYIGYESVTVTIPASGVAVGLVDLGDIVLTPIPKPVPAPVVGGVTGGGVINIGRPSLPPVSAEGYGYLRTRMEKVEDPAYGANSYQITLHYIPFHTNLAVNELSSAQLEVTLPAGISVNNAGGMTATGTSASGITLTGTLNNIPTGKTGSVVFSVKVEDSSAANYYALTCRSAPNSQGGADMELTSAVTLQRLRINLSLPRVVAPATSFTAFGDITGAGENGVELHEVSGSISRLTAVGAKKGRYYYFGVPGQSMGSYRFQARTDRDGTMESSVPVTVRVASNQPEVTDVYINASGTTYPMNPRFHMVSYTAFVNPATLTGPSFEICVKAANVPTGAAVTVKIMGESYSATYDSGDQCWKATIQDYAAYGDYDIMLDINNGAYSTQIGRLLLLF